MNRSEINKFITAKLWDYNLGRGHSYDNVSINGSGVPWKYNGYYITGMEYVRKTAVEGDKIYLEAWKGSGNTTHYVGRYTFIIEEDSDLIESYERYRVPNRIRDRNKQRVYNWESKLNSAIPEDKRKLKSLKEAQDLAKEVFLDYGLDEKLIPDVTINGRLKNYSWYVTWCNTIELQKHWGLKVRVVLHEIAHAVTRWLYGRNHEHDDVFVAVLTEIYQFYLPVADNFDWEAWIEHGVKLGSKYNPNEENNISEHLM